MQAPRSLLKRINSIMKIREKTDSKWTHLTSMLVPFLLFSNSHLDRFKGLPVDNLIKHKNLLIQDKVNYKLFGVNLLSLSRRDSMKKDLDYFLKKVMTCTYSEC